MNRVYFLTGNVNKVKEASVILREYGIKVMKLSGIKKLEIQADSLEEIALTAARLVKNIVENPVIIEDDGIFIEALNGFPGPYSAYVYKKIGLPGILKLLTGIENRKAYFKSVIAYVDPRGNIELFTGVVYGVISYSIRGVRGFGYDPIFIPEGFSRTFAELTIREKCKISHRARALNKFAKWFKNR